MRKAARSTGVARWRERRLLGRGAAVATEPNGRAIEADIPQIGIDWKAGGGTVVNNCHTIQINVPEGSTLTRGGKAYDRRLPLQALAALVSAMPSAHTATHA